MDTGWVEDLDAAGALAAVEDVHARRVAAEAEEFALAAHWAVLHNERTADGGRRPLPGMEQSRRLGADGTPRVSEFAAAELAAALGVSPISGTCLIRDALDVRHRHPRLWEAVTTGRVRVWQARQVAQAAHRAGLDADQARAVDAQTAPLLGTLPWTRFTSVLEARILAADPAKAETRRRQAEAQTYVTAGRDNTHGLRTFIARARGDQVTWLLAMCDRLAGVLADLGDHDPLPQRRATAFGLLGHPHRVLALLAEHDQATREGRLHTTPHHHDEPEPGDEYGDADAPRDDATAATTNRENEPADQPATRSDTRTEDEPELQRPSNQDAATRDTADTTRDDNTHPDNAEAGAGADHEAEAGVRLPGGCIPGCLARLDWRRLLPQVTLYLHLDPAALDTDGNGIARIEGWGPLTVETVRTLLRNSHSPITVKPVTDTAAQPAADAYETPPRLREHLHLRTPADAFPYATSTSRRVDLDHVRPYDPDGPPGQTTLTNLAPLTRHHHRIKTHGGWQLRQPRPGTYLWRTPHDRYYLVDPHGTHRLDPTTGRRWWQRTDPTRPPPHPDQNSPLEQALAALIPT